jgi:hypothetical protein
MFIKAKDIRIQGKESIYCILWRHIANICNQQKELTLAYNHPQLSSMDYIILFHHPWQILRYKYTTNKETKKQKGNIQFTKSVSMMFEPLEKECKKLWIGFIQSQC